MDRFGRALAAGSESWPLNCFEWSLSTAGMVIAP
jgi:hypothetical protein